ncbi:hypothetical protein K438DRAFT_1807341 [Mycena galopus ATCC 62051]|nr:hypothetical protein K438DRAFT_1807341 [Mycena galopus ATCC 62051]
MSDPMKRPARTYGRPRDTVSDEPTPSLQLSGLAWSSSATVSKSAAYNLAEKNTQAPNLSRQSPTVDVADDQASDEEVGDASVPYQFGWKAKMREMDEETDEDSDRSPVANTEDASRRTPLPVGHFPATIPRNNAAPAAHNSPSLQDALPPVEEDIFGGSLPTVTTSSVADVDTVQSTPPPITSHRRGKQRAVVYSSDEDSEDDTKSSGRRARAILHPIASPKLRSSSTPPTSDGEMPAQLAPLLRDSRSKGKSKPSSSRIQVPPLQFNDEPDVGRKKRPSETAPLNAKLKAPTKKDKLETIRDRGRIAGDQRAAVQRVEVSGALTLGKFFKAVQAPKTAGLARTATFDDPISSFSSSPREQRVLNVLIDPLDAPPAETTIVPSEAEFPPLDQSDEEMPDVGDLLHKVTQQKTKEEMQRELQARKLKLAAAIRHRVYANDSEDDDFEIAGPSETKAKDIIVDRGSGSKHKPSEGRKRQLALGGVTMAQQRAKQNATPSKPVGLKSALMTQEQLDKEMAKRVMQTNAELTKKKEDEWVRRGGQVVAVGGGADESARSEALKVFAEQGQKNAEAREQRMQVDFDEDENASDEEWTEEKGSASPRAQEDSDGDTEDADRTMVNPDEDDDDDDAENEAPVQVKSRVPRRTVAIVDSDSENDENAAPLPKSAFPIELVGANRGSISSPDERTEDEGDKENNTHLMYDKSEDKENKAVPRHPFGSRPGLGRQGSLFGLEDGMQRNLSLSPGNPAAMSDENDENNENENENGVGGDRRRPLQNLIPDDPFLAEPGPSPVDDFNSRLQQASPLVREQSPDSPEATLRPSLDPAVRIEAKGFSQFSDDGSMPFMGAPLQPGFSDLFESGTEPKRPLGLSASFSAKSQTGLFALRPKSAPLGLTQDVDLQPAFEVGDRLKRQADAVFEKEQEFLWEAANQKSETRKEELYVNDHGFLTQTRPDVEEPEIYHPSSPPQAGSQLLDPQSLLRRPLRTLSLTESTDFDPPARSPMRRLAKRTETPPPSNNSSPSASPAVRVKKNAFDILQKREVPRPPKRPLEKSEFVAEEAQESDDDEMMAFGGRTRDDGEEEDGEDLDRTLETLVDDKEMDEATVGAARVLEKFQEHAHEDDLANEKYQQAVVQGELRKKRRNRGFGLDDSDDEDEEDEMRARKMRKGLHEPKIVGDVSKLANDPATAPFFNVYRKDLDRGDDQELAYLQQTQPEAGEDVHMDSEGEDERPVLTRKELEERMRAIARQEEDDEPTMDANDVSWIDGDSDGETHTRVKEISRHRARNNPPPSGEREQERMNQWAKQEGRSRNVGTGRASGRNAVTGQNTRAKAGGGSLRAGPQAAAKPTDVRRPLAAKASVLSVVASDRSTRFL